MSCEEYERRNGEERGKPSERKGIQVAGRRGKREKREKERS